MLAFYLLKGADGVLVPRGARVGHAAPVVFAASLEAFGGTQRGVGFEVALAGAD